MPQGQSLCKKSKYAKPNARLEQRTNAITFTITNNAPLLFLSSLTWTFLVCTWTNIRCFTAADVMGLQISGESQWYFLYKGIQNFYKLCFTEVTHTYGNSKKVKHIWPECRRIALAHAQADCLETILNEDYRSAYASSICPKVTQLHDRHYTQCSKKMAAHNGTLQAQTRCEKATSSRGKWDQWSASQKWWKFGDRPEGNSMQFWFNH